MRRVVVTGLGMVTPLGCGVETTWPALLAGKSGARDDRPLRGRRPRLPDRLPDPARRRLRRHLQPRPTGWSRRSSARSIDFIVYAMAAATQALDDAGWQPKTDDDQIATGVLIGSGIGGLGGIDDAAHHPAREGPAPDLALLHSRPADQPRRRARLDRARAQGPEPCGRHRLLDRRARDRRRRAADRPRRCRRDGRRRHRIAGQPPVARRLRRLPGAVDRLQRRADRAPRAPTTATATASSWARAPASSCSRSYEHAKARGAKIYAEVIGYGLSGDAYHITAPSEDGDGAYRCMKAALKRAGIDARRTSTTSTPTAPRRRSATRSSSAPSSGWSATRPAKLVDVVDQVGDRPPARRGRRGRGDLLPILAIRDQVAPPTLNLDNPSVETPIDLVPHQAKKRDIDVALSNSFGFGGTNASLVFRRAAYAAASGQGAESTVSPQSIVG